VQLRDPRGEVSSAVARASVEQHIDEVRACYASALRRDPSLAGSLVTMLTLRANGTVSNVEHDLRSTIEDDRFAVCVQQSLAKARFPPRPGLAGARVTIPFDLSP
jgi:hypothetical protein